MAEGRSHMIRVLIVEDSEDDAMLLLRQLRHGGYKPISKRIDSAVEMQTALEQEHWDLIITDHNMPGFNSTEALELARAHDPNIPFILVSGSIGEEIAVDAMKSGAHDYVMKGNLTRLIPAIGRELREAKNRREHQAAQAKIKHMAFHDSLTGLINRAEFEHRLMNALEMSQQNNDLHALLYIDLDQFKVVNDSCGHLAGDELLRRLSRRLQSSIRDSDTLARLGGDEFGLLLNNCPLDKAESIAHELLEHIRNYVFIWGDRTFKVGASIGLVQITGEKEIAEILSLADMACFAAKDRGRNRIHIHTESDDELTLRRGDLQWLQRLQEAMANNGLLLYSQLIKDLRGTNSHHELLLRMIDDDGGIITPDRFIPAAERFNLMPEIDRWVIHHACEQIHLKRTTEPNAARTLIFVNLSATSLSDDTLADYIKTELETFDLAPEWLGFEITETAAIADFDCALTMINTLRKLGCKVSLDDFGTGMSSFSYLKSLKVDFIKIDGSFVRAMLEDPMDYSIVQAVNTIGHIAGIKTIAEFVETLDIQEKLVELGIDYAQGYAIQRPKIFSSIPPSQRA